MYINLINTNYMWQETLFCILWVQESEKVFRMLFVISGPLFSIMCLEADLVSVWKFPQICSTLVWWKQYKAHGNLETRFHLGS